jgi:hypothetical protein
VVEAVAGNMYGGKEMMELLLSRGDIHITESAVTAVAHKFDAKVVRLLLGRGCEIQITEAVVEAAAGNRRNGKEVMELLLSKSDIQVIEGTVTALSDRFNAEVIRRGDVQITEAVVEAAAGNKGDEKGLIKQSTLGAAHDRSL